MFYEKDLDALFKDLGEEVIINGNSVKAIFSDELKSETIEGEFVQVREIYLVCKSSDVQTVKNRDLVTARGQNYKVVERHENSGITKLFLGEL